MPPSSTLSAGLMIWTTKRFCSALVDLKPREHQRRKPRHHPLAESRISKSTNGPALAKQTEFEIEARKANQPSKPPRNPKPRQDRKATLAQTAPRAHGRHPNRPPTHDGPAEPDKIAAHYTRANKTEVALLLETLAAVGNVRRLDDGRFAVFK